MLIAAITVIFMICLWGVISGFFSLSALKEDRREEQYDSILSRKRHLTSCLESILMR